MKRLLPCILALVCFSNVYAIEKNKKEAPARVEHSILVSKQNPDQASMEKNADRVRSIASITKLMTAIVVLDQLQDTLRKVFLKQSYMGRKEYTVRELLTLMLVGSDNHAAEILSKNIVGSREEFIRLMNQKAVNLGMTQAEFRDPTGLSSGNLATAKDIARLVFAAGSYKEIRETTRANYELTIYDKQPRTVSISNTNKDILKEFDNILVSKTGTTSAAGKCLALLVERNGQQYAVVILGEPDKRKRDTEARNLLLNLQAYENRNNVIGI